jgi:hypothetical protein
MMMMIVIIIILMGRILSSARRVDIELSGAAGGGRARESGAISLGGGGAQV